MQEQDVVALAQGPGKACFTVFRFRGGRLCDREDFLLGEVGSPKSARTEFLQQYYSIRDEAPRQITLDGPLEDAEVLESWLSEKAGRRVPVQLPAEGGAGPARGDVPQQRGREALPGDGSHRAGDLGAR